MSDEQTPIENEQSEDDVRAHGLRSGRDAAQPAETEAHGTRSGRRNDEATGRDEGTERESTQPGVNDDDGPDVEGHRLSARSDARLKVDVRPLFG